jgi:hypothetical protein
MALPINAIESGQSILFLGAGFSRGALNQLQRPIRDGWELTSFFLDECQITDKNDYDLETASEEYSSQKGELQLTETLFKNFMSIQLTDAQRTVICQPWYRIYTSNYDDIIERVSHIDNKPISIKEIADPVEPPSSQRTQVIHIYGSITKVSPQEFRRSFLLTESQRDNSPFLTSAWIWRFNDDVLTAPAIIFCGFSLRDIDLRRLLGRLPPQVHDKTYFVDHPSASRPTIQRLARFGKVELVGVDGFAKALNKKRLAPAPNNSTALPRSVDELIFRTQTMAAIKSPDIENLIVAGQFRLELLSQRDIDGEPGSYLIKRSRASFERATRLSPARPIVAHSDIGNGKTIFALQAAYTYSTAGYRIFHLRGEPEDVSDIVSFFQQVKGKCVVIADDLSRFRTLVAKIIGIGRDDIRVIATARSNFFEAGRALIDTRLGNQSFIEIDLNLAPPDELNRIVQYLVENGLLQHRAELNSLERLRFVREECGGQLRDVILSLFETGALHERVLRLVDSINELSRDVYDLIVLSALLTVIGFEEYGRIYVAADLSEFAGTFEDARRALDEKGLLGLIRIDQGDMLFRSPAFAEFVLRRSAGLKRVLDISKRALFQLDRAYADDPDFDALTRSLLKISAYGRIFKGSEIEETMDNFYDDCRVLKIAKKDPLFLVQRSITNMNMGRFDISNRYVETAYGMAKSIYGYKTYQIDTHHAKLLLTISLNRGITESAQREAKALDLVESVLNLRQDDLYHPISVLRLLGDIARAHGASLEPKERLALKNVLDRAVTRLTSVPSHLRIRFRNLQNIERSLKEAQSSLSSPVKRQ